MLFNKKYSNEVTEMPDINNTQYSYTTVNESNTSKKFIEKFGFLC